MEPVRTCVGCRQRANRSELLRVIRSNDQLTVSGTGAGRGAWIHRSSSCLELAITRKAFGRALKLDRQYDTANLIAHIEQAETMLANK